MSRVKISIERPARYFVEFSLHSTNINRFNMKKILSLFAVALAFVALTPDLALARNPLPPDTVLQGNNNQVPAGAVLKIDGTLTLGNTATASGIVRKISLGTPAVAAVASIVSSANMKVGAYTVADTTPDGTIPRNITVTRTAVSTADTGGTVVVVGTAADGTALTETITVGGDGVTVAGTKAFKTVTSVTGAGWVIAAGNDTITVGFGALVGLPVVLSANGTALTTLATTVANSTTTGDGTIGKSTVDASGGTFNGSKALTVYLDR